MAPEIVVKIPFAEDPDCRPYAAFVQVKTALPETSWMLKAARFTRYALHSPLAPPM